MSCSEWANVLAGVVLILRTSSGPTFDADHTAIDTAHPQVVDRNDRACVGRMTAICGDPSVLLVRRAAPIGATWPFTTGSGKVGNPYPQPPFCDTRGPWVLGHVEKDRTREAASA